MLYPYRTVPCIEIKRLICMQFAFFFFFLLKCLKWDAKLTRLYPIESIISVFKSCFSCFIQCFSLGVHVECSTLSLMLATYRMFRSGKRAFMININLHSSYLSHLHFLPLSNLHRWHETVEYIIWGGFLVVFYYVFVWNIF